MVIQHNLLAWNANRQLKINTGKGGKVSEKLASGYKINRAADDAAGLAMSEKMRRQVRGLNRAAENIQEGVGYVQTADGALNEVHDILHRMNELSVKAANGTLTGQDRMFIDEEIQELKKELDRIFTNTTFNEQKIWDQDETEKIQIGTMPKQAVTVRQLDTRIDVTNDNCDVLAYDSYKINADATDGISISWTGYDGNAYETEKISWDDLKAMDYAFDMSDYFGDPADGVNDNLYDTNGNPVFKHQIAFTVEESATIDDIVTCLNGTYMSHYGDVYMSGNFENTSGGTVSNGMSFYNTSLSYGAAYASNANGTKHTTADGDSYGHDYDAEDDVFLEAADSNGAVLADSGGVTNLTAKPTATTVADARSSSDKWEFTFNMDGIGKVTATSTAVSYGASDRTDDDEGLWWRWIYPTNSPKYKYGMTKSISGGTLGNVMDALTGDKDSSTPGILNKNNASADGVGAADSGGFIRIHFNMQADSDFSYGTTTSKSVGSFTLQFSVSNTDTEQTVLDKINAALNDSTILDFRSTSGGSDYYQLEAANAKTNIIDVPVWGGTNTFHVQAGVEANQHIEVKYDCLSLWQLGLENTHVRTVQASEDAINDIKSALQDVSEQRAVFGAYQNRLEHAYNVNKNTEENTQASESVIRDTDMAETMVEYSNNNILQQVGQAMLAQANQMNQSVMSLLGS